MTSAQRGIGLPGSRSTPAVHDAGLPTFPASLEDVRRYLEGPLDQQAQFELVALAQYWGSSLLADSRGRLPVHLPENEMSLRPIRGHALAVLGSTVAEAARRWAIGRCATDYFAIQLVGATYQGAPYVFLAIWVPGVPQPTRCILWGSPLEEIMRRPGFRMGFGNERTSVRDLLQEMLPHLCLPTHHLVAVIVQLVPSRRSIYDVQLMNGQLELMTIVPLDLDTSEFHRCVPDYLLGPIIWLESCRAECCRDTQLEAALTSFGLVGFRFPARESYQFLPALVQCCEALLQHGPAVTDVLRSGPDSAVTGSFSGSIPTRLDLAEALERPTFTAECRLLVLLFSGPASGLRTIESAPNLATIVAAVSDVLNHLLNVVTVNGASCHKATMWNDDLLQFRTPDITVGWHEAPELDAVDVSGLENHEGGPRPTVHLRQSYREALRLLALQWLHTWRFLLASQTARCLLLPYLPLSCVHLLRHQLGQWVVRVYQGDGVAVIGEIDALYNQEDEDTILLTMWMEGRLVNFMATSHLIGRLLVANRYVFLLFLLSFFAFLTSFV